MADRSFEVTGTLADDGVTIVFDHANMLKKLFKSSFAGKKLAIKIEVHRQNRSAAQNRWIWGVCVPCVRAWIKQTQGEVKDKDEVYLWLRMKFIGDKPEIKTVMGEEVIIMTGKRFSQMTTKEFAEAMESIVNQLAELGCNVPLPTDQNFLTDFIKDE